MDVRDAGRDGRDKSGPYGFSRNELRLLARSQPVLTHWMQTDEPRSDTSDFTSHQNYIMTHPEFLRSLLRSSCP